MAKYSGKMSDHYEKEPGILSEYLDYLADNNIVSRQTAYNYYMQLRLLAKFLKHRRKNMDCQPDEVEMSSVTKDEMMSITEDEWFDFLDYCQFTQKDTAGTLSVRISSTRKFFEWLGKNMNVTPPAHVISTARPAPVYKEFRIITHGLEDKICKALRGDNVSRNACIIKLFIHCGLGLEEICALNMEDVELKSLQVRSSDGKTRTVALDEECVNAINDYLPDRIPPTDGSNALFVGSKNKKRRLRRGAVEKMLRKAVASIGMPAKGISIRDLQMTAKVRLASQTEDLDTVREQTNVSSVHYFRKAYRRRLQNMDALNYASETPATAAESAASA